MNSAGSGNCSQTCGRKVERWLPAVKMTPSMSGRSWARASASSREVHRLGRRQQRDFDAGDGQLVGAQRLEARVAEGGVAGVFLNVSEQRTPGFQAADAAAQLAALGQGDEGGAVFVQFRQVNRNRRRRQAEAGGDGVTCQRQQCRSEVSHDRPPHGRRRLHSRRRAACRPRYRRNCSGGSAAASARAGGQRAAAR